MLALRIILFVLLMFQNISAQKQAPPGKYHPPLTIPLYLSGNFGELRSDHFHSGVDFKTQGVIGKSVHAVEEGYVSRIKIQTLGYGNSIYITHPDGITSVYGHLDSFIDTVSDYVKAYQYQKKTHTLDIYPDKELFKVKRGEVIAFSGNTGSSGGPHLHFELRGTSSQHPLNALLYGFDVKDNISPKLYNLYVYPLERTTGGRYSEPLLIPLTKSDTAYHLSTIDTLYLSGNIGFGLEAYDYLNDASNRCGVFSIELFLNDIPVYVFKIDEFSFQESSYINAHTDYHQKAEKERKVHLLYRKPNNRLSLYPLLVNDGLIRFKVDETSKVNIRVKDTNGNSSELTFYAKGSAIAIMSQKTDSALYKTFRWSSPNYFENSQIKLSIPANSLYEDCFFNYARSDAGYQNFYPFTHFIGDTSIPLHKAASLSISGKQIPEHLRNKTSIAYLNGDNKISCLLSLWNGEMITARINKLGKYTLVLDTISPKIVPLNIISGADMSSKAAILFKLNDDLTGISEYRGFIDNDWVLFEYDPKNELLFYTFDQMRLKSGIDHELVVHAKDASGNEKIFKTYFVW
jgi:hypothetical protein